MDKNQDPDERPGSANWWVACQIATVLHLRGFKSHKYQIGDICMRQLKDDSLVVANCLRQLLTQDKTSQKAQHYKK
jgi:hypothetical protein